MVNVGTVDDSPALGGGYGVGRWRHMQGKSAKRPANVGAPNQRRLHDNICLPTPLLTNFSSLLPILQHHHQYVS